MKKVLFIDRDGTIILETDDFKIETLEKVTFYPEVFYWLGKIVRELEYELVLVTNQDGLGTEYFPDEPFFTTHKFIMKTFADEGIKFSAEHIDRHYSTDDHPERKPGVGMLTKYFSKEYDLKNSFVIGDRITDVMLAKNLGGKSFWLNDGRNLGTAEVGENNRETLKDYIAVESRDWSKIYKYLISLDRKTTISRTTKETNIAVELNLDGNGNADISTGLNFFNHMLEQIAKHGNLDLKIFAEGDLHIDEHHTIEDTAITLGEAFHKAIGNKKGMERYGFCLPMDDCLAQVAIDFGGRNWLEWQVDFKREKIGDVPTEMFVHFFKSFSDSAKCNLNIIATGENEHHKIEAVFKAFAKAIKMAVKQDKEKMILPTTKGIL
jgi:imidazoleglycerol-phosphate dehydratase/histidinol-phosphatase